ncbi:caspase family protein [Roseateles sp.]|uniref:caspase family protein n=1 Tax=Roseateles sp. TaxID=1971397 RepID=UPI003BAB4587
MTTFRLDTSEGPGTHVFIVGVGKYDHLLNGAGPVTARTGNMGQLTSPQRSAKAVLEWFDKTMNNPSAPLKSIEALISDVDVATYPEEGQPKPIDQAYYDQFEACAKAWFDRANSDPRNVAVFYFCGHGLANGIETQLLLSDYGKSSTPLRHAINFNGFRMAMHACQATSQIFFVDACRVVDSATLVDPDNLGYSGLGPVNVTRMFRGSNPVLFAARIGKQAFGDPDQVSDFTKALLAGLTKYGARRNKQQDWAISPQHLQLAVAALMDDFSGDSHCQTDGISGSGFDLHILNEPPDVVVHVSVAPPEKHVGAVLRATHGIVVRERDGDEHPWRTILPIGNARITADFPQLADAPQSFRDVTLMGPMQEVELGVLWAQ